MNITNSNEVFLDYKLQHKLQRHLNTLPYNQRLQLKSLLSCKRSVLRASNYRHVDVVTERKGHLSTARYINLYNCKSLWSCPTCAGYGLEIHRRKISAIIDYLAERGYWACMVTYTVPHNNSESCATVYGRLKLAMSKMHASKYLPQSKGSIKATEFTYNDGTGWHPHFHTLYFIPAASWHKLPDAFDKMYKRWLAILEELGYKDADHQNGRAPIFLSLNKHGKPRRIANGDYIAKEIAKLKRGKHNYKSRTPFQLLDSLVPRDLDRFIEYAMVTKGCSRVKYSTHLAPIQEITALVKKKALEEATAVTEAYILCSFKEDDWYKIVDDEFKTGRRHRRRILICAAMGNIDRIIAYCFNAGLPLPLPPQRRLAGAAGYIAA